MFAFKEKDIDVEQIYCLKERRREKSVRGWYLFSAYGQIFQNLNSEQSQKTFFSAVAWKQ